MNSYLSNFRKTRNNKVIPILLSFLSIPVLFLSVFLLNRNDTDTRSDAALLQSTASRGYMITPPELLTINTKANNQIEPYKTNRSQFLAQSQYVGSGTAWSWGTMSNNGSYRVEDVGASYGTCGTDVQEKFLKNGGASAYAKAIAYHLTADVTYAQTVRAKALELAKTYDYGDVEYSGSNNCILELAWSIPMWIQAVDLLADWSGWTAADKEEFQEWLAGVAYKKTAWSSRVRKNNWGAGGSAASAFIADYVYGSRFSLTEIMPATKTLTPTQAYKEHMQLQKDRMNTVWKGDSQCGVWGIQANGGFPDELRRGSTGCNGSYIVDDDSSLAYMSTIGETFILSAELALRRGDDTIYKNVAANGSGSILNLIRFVIDNPQKSWDWKIYKKSPLYAAYRFYRHSAIKQRLVTNNTSPKSSDTWPWGRLTHDFAETEYSGQVPLPPVVAAPGELALITSSVAATTPKTTTITATPIQIESYSNSTTSEDLDSPAVSITSPSRGSIIKRNRTIEITATASDRSGIERVEFYTEVNGVTSIKCTENVAPYTCSLKVGNITNQTYLISAKAYDKSGNFEADTVSILVK